MGAISSVQTLFFHMYMYSMLAYSMPLLMFYFVIAYVLYLLIWKVLCSYGLKSAIQIKLLLLLLFFCPASIYHLHVHAFPNFFVELWRWTVKPRGRGEKYMMWNWLFFALNMFGRLTVKYIYLKNIYLHINKNKAHYIFDSLFHACFSAIKIMETTSNLEGKLKKKLWHTYENLFIFPTWS